MTLIHGHGHGQSQCTHNRIGYHVQDCTLAFEVHLKQGELFQGAATLEVPLEQYDCAIAAAVAV
jgi:hypothetical protein